MYARCQSEIELKHLMKLQLDKMIKTEIVNSMERLTLADQFQCMGNQAVTQELTELAEVRNYYQANKMFSSADDVHQLSSFGKDMNLMRSSWKMNQSQDENIWFII